MIDEARRQKVAEALAAVMPPKYNAHRFVGREMDELAGLLDPEELPLMATSATATIGRKWQSVLAVGTSFRLIIFDRGFGRSGTMEFLYEDIRTVDAHVGWFAFGRIGIIPKTGAPIVLGNVPKKHVRTFADWLSRQIREANAARR